MKFISAQTNNLAPGSCTKLFQKIKNNKNPLEVCAEAFSCHRPSNAGNRNHQCIPLVIRSQETDGDGFALGRRMRPFKKTKEKEMFTPFFSPGNYSEICSKDYLFKNDT